MKVFVKRLAFYIVLIGIWQLVALQINIQSQFPEPLAVASALYEGFLDGSLPQAILQSFKHLIVGLAISVFLGTSLGVLLAKSKTADDTLGSMILALQSVPGIVWVPLALLWFGFSSSAIIFVIVIGGTFVMAMNMRVGMMNVPPLYVQAAKTMGSSGLDLFFKVMIPSSVPYAVTGLKLAWAFGWRGLMAGEMLGGIGGGLGYTLQFASDFAQPQVVFAVIIIIGVIGACVDQFILQKIERSVLRRWGLSKNI
ncbi:ABC transporter permease [Aureibacillus halotolerans]|uniref:NitT/TauT family transport system permease protein n=1 Tax=Aureibacillus halotolerans TaxID=1508390 RepID=A0A4R6U6J3_9BACI|nr:ABC transporter permease [Aureibacillus halotolerans]TDQ40493.1 NitT/TauT family transport system permease protein [Aureibacillus halotolerans]